MSDQAADRERRGPTLLKRNALIVDEKGFKGEWVAIPREDFDYTKARVERYREALEGITRLGPDTHNDPVMAMEAAAQIAHRALNEGEDDGESNG